ncbi:aKG-HExxH-type peptide beta-hydroxylase [Streptomyces goshikiensis]|uniref:aKG-HExxH-type peptide beta-hydroxylase n=1 Tax=Streptomyces goshikiensis TaxID=1942 RepID=UPI00371AD956
MAPLWDADPDMVGVRSLRAQAWPPHAEATVPLALPHRRVAKGRLRGRDGLVANLTAAAARRSGGDPAPPRVWVLSGMGGCGKTTVALEAAHELANASTQVWWVPEAAEVGNWSLYSALRSVAIAAGAQLADFVGTHPAEVLWKHLDALSSPWLLVLDNIDDPAALAGASMPTARGAGWLREPAHPWGTVLITSRESRATRWGDWVGMVGVDVLSAEDSAQVLCDLAPEAGTAQEAMELAEHLGGLPLALDLAGSYLARARASTLPSPSMPETFANYRLRLDAHLSDMASDPDIDLEPRERTRRALVSTWELSLDLLHGQEIELARPLLRLLCAFGPAPLPYLELLDSEILAQSELFDNPDHARLLAALDGLKGLKLITVEVPRDAAGTPADTVRRRLTIHPMVRAAGRAHPDFAEQAPRMLGLVTALLLRVTGPLKPASPANWPMWRALASHCGAAHHLLSACADRLGEAVDPNLVTAATEPSTSAAHYLNQVGMYSEAIAELDVVCALRGRLLGNSSPATIAARLHLAWALRDNGDLAAADRLYQDLARAAADSLPADHPYLQSVHTGRARVLRELGRYEQAEDELNAALVMRRRAPQGGPLGILRVRHDLASLANKRGRYEEAVVELRDVVRGVRALGAEGELDAPAMEVSLARALRDAGHAEEAAESAERAIQEFLQVLAPDHPDVLLARHERARILRDHEREPELLERARDEFADIWRTAERRLGPEHPDVLATRHELATVWDLLGRPDLAAEHFREVLEGAKQRLGEDHPHVAVCERNLAAVLASPVPLLSESLSSHGDFTMNCEPGAVEFPPAVADPPALSLAEALSAGHDSGGSGPAADRALSLFVYPRQSRGGGNPAGGGFSEGSPAPRRTQDPYGSPHRTYRPATDLTRERTPSLDFPNDADLRMLATGQEDVLLIEQLRARERKTRFDALAELLRLADAPHLHHSEMVPTIPQLRDLLLEASDTDPEAVTAVLLHPSVGRWLSRALRALYATTGGSHDTLPGGLPGSDAVDLPHLHAVVAAAAVRAQLTFTLPIPVRDGFAALPTLGSADLRSSGSTTARIVASAYTTEVKCRDTTVRLPRPGALAPQGWIPAQRVRTPAGSGSFNLVLDDADPYRGTDGPMAPSLLSSQNAVHWRQTTSEAATLLAETVPRQAAAMASVLTALTPLPAARDSVMTSVSSSDAFGGAVLSSPPDAVELAATLVHEFRHMKLNCVLKSVDLYVAEAEAVESPLYYAPWRDDPRPLSGFFHGVFAFFGVVDFWRRLARRVEGETLRRCQFQLTYWRRQTLDAYAALCSSPHLTARGVEFTQMMHETADTWTDHAVVPDALAALATDAVLVHRVRWRVHHLRPVVGAVSELTHAWLAGAPCPPRLGDRRIASAVRPDRDVPSLNDYTMLLCRSATGPSSRASRSSDDSVPSWPRLAEPWSRLLLTLRIAGSESGDAAANTAAAVRSLTHCPEVVRAVHTRAATITGSPPDPAALAAWIDVPDRASDTSGLPLMIPPMIPSAY